MLNPQRLQKDRLGLVSITRAIYLSHHSWGMFRDVVSDASGMSFFDLNANFERRSLSEFNAGSAEQLPCKALLSFDFGAHLEMLALFLAQAWKDDHPHAIADSEDDVNQCILAVTTELAIAAKAVGGPVGLEILTGGGSVAARAVCKRVLSDRN